MLNNPDIIKNAYKCEKKIADYLIKCKIPILGIKDNYVYFTNNDELKECLKRMPLLLKALDWLK